MRPASSYLLMAASAAAIAACRFAPIGARFEPEQVAGLTGIYTHQTAYLDSLFA